MTSQYYRLIWHGTRSNAAELAGIDITAYVISLDKFTSVGSGEVCTAKLMLKAQFGHFVTDATVKDGKATTPIIRPFDLCRLAVVDDDGDLDDPAAGHSYWRWLVVGRRTPQRTGLGQHLDVELYGREWYLQRIMAPGRHYFRSFLDVAKSIRDAYNDQKADSQPAIRSSADKADIDVPSYTWGIFEFGEQISCYDALIEVMKRLSLPVAAGGDGEEYGLVFRDVSWTDPSQIAMRLAPRGSQAAKADFVQLEKPLSFTEVREPLEANVVVVEGQEGAGTIPPQIAEFRSYLEEWNNIPEWAAGVPYPADAYVQRAGNRFRRTARAAPAPAPPPAGNAHWTKIDLYQYMNHFLPATEQISAANHYQYSPWTQHKAAIAKNQMGNPAGTLDVDRSSLACPDFNTIIRGYTNPHGGIWRSWVDCVARGPSEIPAAILYAGRGLFHGLRVLNLRNGDRGAPLNLPARLPADAWSGSDKYGRPYANAILQYSVDGEWIVFKEAQRFNEAAVLRVGRIYEYNKALGSAAAPDKPTKTYSVRDLSGAGAATAGLGWRDISATPAGNDCFHYPAVVQNVGGLLTLPAGIGPNYFSSLSALQIEYHRNEIGAVGEAIGALITKIIPAGIGAIAAWFQGGWEGAKAAFHESLTEGDLDTLFLNDTYNDGWWAPLLAMPFPPTSDNGIQEAVGGLWGGSGDDKVPLLDLQNLTRTPSGKTGWGSDDSSSLGRIQGIRFLIRLDIDGPAWESIPGDLPCSLVMGDIYDNVWRARFSVRYQQITQPVYLDLSAFSIYRAQIQPNLTVPNYVLRAQNIDLAVTEQFDPRLVKWIRVQLDVGYDDQGRYDPWSWESFVRKWVSAVPNATIKFIGEIDALCFIRSALAIASEVRAGEPQLETRKTFPQVSNTRQLAKIARSELDIARHQRDYVEAKYERLCEVSAEDGCYATDADLVAEAEKAGSAGTIEMICKKVTYSVTTVSGSGALVADVELFRRVGQVRS